MTDSTQRLVGRVAMRGKDTDLTMHCNALAFNPSAVQYELMLLSVAGSSSTIKAVSTALNCRAKIEFRPEDIPGIPYHYKLYRTNSPYRIYRHRMSYGTWHLLAMASQPGLLTQTGEESLWRALQSHTYTTPMLRSWVPWIRSQLLVRDLLRPLRCFGCSASLLTATDVELDDIVSLGVQITSLHLEDAA